MQRLRAWLIAVPGRDAIERRQAYLLQVVLLLLVAVLLVATLSNALATT